jgi:membrane protein implicated in regulation of membrane protease activity
MQTYQFIYLLALILAVFEIFSTTFILLGFSLGLCTVAFIEQFFGGLGYSANIFVFTFVSAIAIFIFRKFFRSSNDFKKSDGDVNQY